MMYIVKKFQMQICYQIVRQLWSDFPNILKELLSKAIKYHKIILLPKYKKEAKKDFVKYRAILYNTN